MHKNYEVIAITFWFIEKHCVLVSRKSEKQRERERVNNELLRLTESDRKHESA